MSIPKFKITVWRKGESVPVERVAILPVDDFGTVSSDVERLETELISNQADDKIDGFTIVQIKNDELDLQQTMSWLESFRD